MQEMYKINLLHSIIALIKVPYSSDDMKFECTKIGRLAISLN